MQVYKFLQFKNWQLGQLLGTKMPSSQVLQFNIFTQKIKVTTSYF